MVINDAGQAKLAARNDTMLQWRTLWDLWREDQVYAYILFFIKPFPADHDLSHL